MFKINTYGQYLPIATSQRNRSKGLYGCDTGVRKTYQSGDNVYVFKCMIIGTVLLINYRRIKQYMVPKVLNLAAAI